MTFTDAAAVSDESAATAPIANDQTAPLPASGTLRSLKIGSYRFHSSSEGLPLVLRTCTFPLGTETFDRSTLPVPRVVEFTTVTAAPTLALPP